MKLYINNWDINNDMEPIMQSILVPNILSKNPVTEGKVLCIKIPTGAT